MAMYILESGKVIDTTSVVRVWQSEHRDASLCLFPDGHYILFIWDEDRAYEVASLEEARHMIVDIG
jgi:hypothetical protein